MDNIWMKVKNENKLKSTFNYKLGDVLKVDYFLTFKIGLRRRFSFMGICSKISARSFVLRNIYNGEPVKIAFCYPNPRIFQIQKIASYTRFRVKGKQLPNKLLVRNYKSGVSDKLQVFENQNQKEVVPTLKLFKNSEKGKRFMTYRKYRKKR